MFEIEILPYQVFWQQNGNWILEVKGENIGYALSRVDKQWASRCKQYMIKKSLIMIL